MANEEYLAILEQGVEIWNQWRKENPEIRPDLSRANLPGEYLCGANLSWANLHLANLMEADLCGANLYVVDLCEVDLRGAYLIDADLSRADLNEANLSGAKLCRANLSRAFLFDVNFSDADFSGANLSGASFKGANLNGANLSGANLSEAHFDTIDLRKTNLDRADLNGASLHRADLSGANLSGTKLTKVMLGWTSFGNVDLSQVEGLDTVEHLGPSTIGIDTIYRSQGKIPESFLRGAGVPEDFVAFIDSFIAGKSIQFYSCFISYSDLDRPFAERLHADLRDKGVRCWYAPEDMKIGSKIRQTVDDAIRLRDKLLVVMSEHSLASAWVEDEVEAAFEEERRRQKTVLFPVRLDDKVMESNKGWASKLRQRHIGDFRQWKHHDEYEAAFERLLRDLRAEEDGD